MARNKINPDPPLAAPEPMSSLKRIIVFIVGLGLLIAIICFPFFQDMNSKDYQITSLVSASTTPQMWIISFHHPSNDFPIVDYTHFQVLLFYIHDDHNNNSYGNYNNSGKPPKSTLIAQSNNLIKQGQWVTTDLVMLHSPSGLVTTPLGLDDVPFQVGISLQYSLYTKDESHDFSCTYVTMVSDNVSSWLSALDLPKYC